jgi:SAM-dependent methyltransferase
MTWAEHWDSGHTPWDAGASAPALAQLLATWPVAGELPPGGTALVSGCGAGHDVFTLAKAGYLACGVDIAEGTAPRFAELRRQFAVEETRARLQITDFFTAAAESLGGPFDLIWDYTFYCAIEPKLRAAWSAQMARLLAPGGRLAMLIFPVVAGAPKDRGPPYPLEPSAVVEELKEQFTNLHLASVEESHPGREGKEWLAVFKHRG